jgi:hypothetical protein
VELVQWIVPLEDGGVAVGWAPVWADRMPALGRLSRPVRRRGAPLVSRWLATPLTVGAFEKADGKPEDVDDTPARALKPGALSVVLSLAGDSEPPRPVLGPDADDVRFAGVFAELVRVLADLCEAAGLPAAGIAPTPERKGLELSVGALGTHSAVQLGDTLLLLRTAVESCAQARGLKLVDAHVRVDEKRFPLDGRVARAFARSGRDDKERS